jgi:hypothetical protein
MVKSLNEEIVILGIAKGQLEQAVVNYFANELTLTASELIIKDELLERIALDVGLDAEQSLRAPLERDDVAAVEPERRSKKQRRENHSSKER